MEVKILFSWGKAVGKKDCNEQRGPDQKRQFLIGMAHKKTPEKSEVSIFLQLEIKLSNILHKRTLLRHRQF